MSYENAVPKPLKFLISDGKLVDESGNVIAESDSLQEFYIKSSPQVKKYLLSDGSVVDEENNLIIKNDYFKKMYEQADPKVAKYLHADGTIDENPGGGSGADLENNHQVTIDVSTYANPVEITPTAGKDGMKKATVTLSNIPSESNKLYAFEQNGGYAVIYALKSTLSVGDKVVGVMQEYAEFLGEATVVAVDDTKIYLSEPGPDETYYERYPEGDFEF